MGLNPREVGYPMGIHTTEDSQMNTKRFFKTWELALLAALCMACLSGLWASRTHTEIADQMIRLHVLAASDSETEQAVKLEVRDAVLEDLRPKLAACTGKEDAAAVLEAALPAVEAAALSAAGDRDVTVSLSEEYYPTRDYDGFSLPAGRYTSLRVVLGEGAGHNWWCVVYPPLCVTAAEASQEAIETLNADTAQIITESDGYVVKFKLLELWGELTAWLG